MAGHAKTRIRTIEDNKRAAGVAVTPATEALAVDETATLTSARIDHGGATLDFATGAITYASDDAGVATVHATSGLVTAIAEGDCVITASCVTALNGTVTDTTAVNVTDPVIAFDDSTIDFAADEGGADPDVQTVLVSNDGNGTLAPMVGVITYGMGEDTGWLAGEYDADTGLVTLTATTGALAADTYHAAVPITSVGASNSPQSITVTFVVS